MCKIFRCYKATVAHFGIAESSLCIACEGDAVKCLMEMEKFIAAQTDGKCSSVGLFHPDGRWVCRDSA